MSCQNYIGGAWHKSEGKTLDVISPYTGASIGTVPISTTADIEAAISKAKAAFFGWRATPVKERTQVLLRWRELLLQDLDTLAHTAAAECGKTVGEARAEVLKGIEVTEFACSLQNLDVGGALEVSRGVQCEFRREPLGVVAGIAPFNFPAMVPMWMYPIAIALGNCFVLKPSEKVPLTSQLVAELFAKAGLPAGVFSLVNGDRTTVEYLLQHRDIQAVGFVGSSEAALAVYRAGSNTGKRVLALGGAKNNLIVVPDADPEITTKGVLDSFTGCAGQRCMAASLMLAVGKVDHIIDSIAKAAGDLQLGAMMGAIIDKPALTRIHSAIAAAEKAGAKILVDGRKFAAPKGYEGGNWIGPTIIDQATIDMDCARAEIFGPLITIVRTETLPQAICLEHGNQYGNATSIFTTSGASARYVSDNASAGMIGINIGVPVPREPFSFGGTKTSKYGHGDITGVSAVELWTHRKKITSKWSIQRDATWMS